MKTLFRKLLMLPGVEKKKKEIPIITAIPGRCRFICEGVEAVEVMEHVYYIVCRLITLYKATSSESLASVSFGQPPSLDKSCNQPLLPLFVLLIV